MVLEEEQKWRKEDEINFLSDQAKTSRLEIEAQRYRTKSICCDQKRQQHKTTIISMVEQWTEKEKKRLTWAASIREREIEVGPKCMYHNLWRSRAATAANDPTV